MAVSVPTQHQQMPSLGWLTSAEAQHSCKLLSLAAVTKRVANQRISVGHRPCGMEWCNELKRWQQRKMMCSAQRCSLRLLSTTRASNQTMLVQGIPGCPVLTLLLQVGI